jgi:DNA-binding transcriptional LysR family regulator
VSGGFSATDGTVLREAVVAGLGLSVVPFFLVASDVAAGRLELVLEGHRKAEIGIYAVVSSSRGLPLRVRALLEHLTRWFAKPHWREPETSGTRSRRRAGAPSRRRTPA